MSAGSLARRYAKALMSIGVDEGSYAQMGTQLASVSKAIASSPELSDILENPVVSRTDREKVVLAILQRVGASKTVENFCRLLLERERMQILPDIQRELQAMIDEKSGQVTAEIRSAKALTPAQEIQLKSTLEKLSGKSIRITVKEDPSLLGGVVAKVGDLVYDGSLRTQLSELRRNLGGE